MMFSKPFRVTKDPFIFSARLRQETNAARVVAAGGMGAFKRGGMLLH